MINHRTMTGPRRVDTRWPQTVVMPRRAERTRDNPYRRQQSQGPNWGLCLMCAGAAFLAFASLLYACTGPAQ
jgi:hypothetical protein